MSRATVGEGEIIVRDKAKQKELEESGKTNKLANLNRDLDKTQEVTKDEETEINLYVSDTSTKVLLKAAEPIVNAIGDAIDQLAEDLKKAFSEEEKKAIANGLMGLGSGDVTKKQFEDCIKSTGCDSVVGVSGEVYLLGGDGHLADDILGITGRFYLDPNIANTEKLISANLFGQNRQDASQSTKDGLSEQIDFFLRAYAYAADIKDPVLRQKLVADIGRTFGGMATRYADTTLLAENVFTHLSPDERNIFTNAYSGGAQEVLDGLALEAVAAIGASSSIVNTLNAKIPGLGGSLYAASVANRARLNHQLTARQISDGHAFEKHVLKQGEFSGLDIRTRKQFSNHIENVMNNPSSIRYAKDGRVFYLQKSTGTIVIRNPKVPDGGTAFQPSDWQNYIAKDIPSRNKPY